MTKVIFPFYKYSREKLRELEKDFMPNWEDITDYEHWDQPPETIQSPNRRIYNLEECLMIASEKLEIGNKKQINALKALEFFNYLYQAKRIPYKKEITS